MKFRKTIISTITIIFITSVILFNSYYYHNNFGQQNLLHIGNRPLVISVNPHTNVVHITNSNDNTVSVIDGKTNIVITNIKVGSNPTGVSFNPLTNVAYVTNSNDNTVSVIDGKTAKDLSVES
ncbi:MAG: hypothetical protein M3Z01_04725 [Thermoproteota archaeon]|nr:hypothetical protein [Thermoproteota archaeon]